MTNLHYSHLLLLMLLLLHEALLWNLWHTHWCNSLRLKGSRVHQVVEHWSSLLWLLLWLLLLLLLLLGCNVHTTGNTIHGFCLTCWLIQGHDAVYGVTWFNSQVKETQTLVESIQIAWEVTTIPCYHPVNNFNNNNNNKGYLFSVIVQLRVVFRKTVVGDISSTWAVVIFRVKWRVIVRWWYLCLWSWFGLVSFVMMWLVVKT